MRRKDVEILITADSSIHQDFYGGSLIILLTLSCILFISISNSYKKIVFGILSFYYTDKMNHSQNDLHLVRSSEATNILMNFSLRS